MNENDVRKRIQGRKAYGVQPTKKRSHFFSFIYRMMILGMGVAIVTLAFFINQKAGFVKLPEELTSLNFAMVSEWVPFEKWFAKESEAVSAQPTYSLLKENQYANGSNQAGAIKDGVVLHVQQGDNYKGSTTIRHDNGVVATYGNLDQINVKADERILQGSILGSFQEYVSIDFLKDEVKLDLATALQ